MCSTYAGSAGLQGFRWWNTENEKPEHKLSGTRLVFRLGAPVWNITASAVICSGHATSNSSIEIACAISRILRWVMCLGPIGALQRDVEILQVAIAAPERFLSRGELRSDFGKVLRRLVQAFCPE